jgi:SET domain-containing protein
MNEVSFTSIEWKLLKFSSFVFAFLKQIRDMMALKPKYYLNIFFFLKKKKTSLNMSKNSEKNSSKICVLLLGSNNTSLAYRG